MDAIALWDMVVAYGQHLATRISEEFLTAANLVQIPP